MSRRRGERKPSKGTIVSFSDTMVVPREGEKKEKKGKETEHRSAPTARWRERGKREGGANCIMSRKGKEFRSLTRPKRGGGGRSSSRRKGKEKRKRFLLPSHSQGERGGRSLNLVSTGRGESESLYSGEKEEKKSVFSTLFTKRRGPP